MDLSALYQEIILDHYRSPHHAGLREPYEAEVHHVNPTCGDEVTLRVHLDDGTVGDVSYDAVGCSISQASASMMTESVKGQQLRTADALTAGFKNMMSGNGSPDDLNGHEDLEALQGVKRFPVRIKCALLPWTALAEAVDKWRSAAPRSQESGVRSQKKSFRRSNPALVILNHLKRSLLTPDS